MIQISESAVSQLKNLLSSRSAEAASGLRVKVERGGCAGLQYTMEVDQQRPGDHLSIRDDVRVLVDEESLKYLDGSEIDYVDDLNDAGFKVRNPNAARSCGCGTSFEPAATPE